MCDVQLLGGDVSFIDKERRKTLLFPGIWNVVQHGSKASLRKTWSLAQMDAVPVDHRDWCLQSVNF